MSKQFRFSVKTIISVLLIGFMLSLYGCPESTKPTNGASGNSFLMGYNGGGDYGDAPGLVSVSFNGKSISRISDFYPHYFSTDYLDMKNGRIAMTCDNNPDSLSPIAYMDENNLSNIKFIPIPKSGDEDYYWEVNYSIRPQVLSDGRIMFKATYNTVNPYDDYHDGMLVIYNPADESFTFSGSLSGFVLDQPEQGPDTEGGSMGSSFALSPDDNYAFFDAYGYGTDAGVFHVDYHFIVQWDINNGGYQRIDQANTTILFVSNDGNNLVYNKDGKKYKININSKAETKLDDNTNYISVGQIAKKSDLFFKVWRGSGLSLFDLNSGWLYDPILGDSLEAPYRGLGSGAQFSADESRIYFTASTDFYTNYDSPFEVMSTKISSSNQLDTKPDSLFVLPAEFDTKMFLLLK